MTKERKQTQNSLLRTGQTLKLVVDKFNFLICGFFCQCPQFF